jgi:hypothetical protein
MPGAAWVVAVDAATIAGQAGLGPLVALGDLVEVVNHGCLD